MRLKIKVRKSDLYSVILFIYLFVKFNMLDNARIYYMSDYIMFVLAGVHWILKNRKSKQIDYAQLVWYIVFFIFCYMSKSWSTNVLYVHQVIVLMRGLLITIFVLIEYMTDFNNWKRFLKIFVFACLTHGIYATITTPYSNFGTNLFGAATGYYFNNIAQIIAFGVCVAVYLYYEEGNIMWWLVIGVMCAVIGITGSRKAILMAIGFIIIFILFSKQHTIKRIRQIILSIVILIGLYYLVMTNDFLYEQIGSRLATVFAIFGRNDIQADYSTLERLYLIDQGWNLFLNNKVHGVGINNFKAHVGGYLGAIPKYAHNNYIELLSDLGLIGFVLYYIRYLYLAIACIKNRINNTDLLICAMMAILLILEYGNVTYYFVQYQIVLIIICTYLKLRKNAVKYEQK